tara:strand:+ start:219 stop:455 length:237 start_codon:yes stop_codon:yes gene_type:complete
MLRNLWTSSRSAAEKLGLTEKELSYLREIGLLKPGIHWKSSSKSQPRPWNPEAVYNLNICKNIIMKINLMEISEQNVA